MHDEKTIEWYKRRGVEPPETNSHGTEEDIKQNMERLMPNSWRLEGNKLIGETKYGPLCQFIPTNYILINTDKNGLPVFREVEVDNN